MRTYKYALALTSQLPFCSTPLRLDAYNKCQFSCAFCFAKARGGNSDAKGVQFASASALRARLNRVQSGDVRNAIDEFLQRRVPLQFGGMNDPFSPWELKYGVGLELLKVLADFKYPTLISTKSVVPAESDYLAVLRSGNFYVRVSFTGASIETSQKLELLVPEWGERRRLIQGLSIAGVAVSIRLQPLVFGDEESLVELLGLLANDGAKHVSAEYLKWPIESSSKEFGRLNSLLPGMLDKYFELGAKKIGREYVLPPEVKLPNLVELKHRVDELGMVFGFAETELLHLNPYQSCCNAADRFLEDCNPFEGTFTSIIKEGGEEEIRLPQPLKKWLPQYSVFSHLNSRSRPAQTGDTPAERYQKMLRDKWNSKDWRGGPLSYWGIESSSSSDKNGNQVYLRAPELRQLLEKNNLNA